MSLPQSISQPSSNGSVKTIQISHPIAPSKAVSSDAYAFSEGRRIAVNAVALRQIAKRDAAEKAFSELSPRQRIVKLAKSDLFGLASSILAIPIAIYTIYRALDETLHLFGMAVFAQVSGATSSVNTPSFVAGSSRDAFDWYVGALMGLVLIISVAATYFAQTEKKVEFGKDTTKTIVGFLVGFLGGGKVGIK